MDQEIGICSQEKRKEVLHTGFFVYVWQKVKKTNFMMHMCLKS